MIFFYYFLLLSISSHGLFAAHIDRTRECVSRRGDPIVSEENVPVEKSRQLSPNAQSVQRAETIPHIVVHGSAESLPVVPQTVLAEDLTDHYGLFSSKLTVKDLSFQLAVRKIASIFVEQDIQQNTKAFVKPGNQGQIEILFEKILSLKQQLENIVQQQNYISVARTYRLYKNREKELSEQQIPYFEIVKDMYRRARDVQFALSTMPVNDQFQNRRVELQELLNRYTQKGNDAANELPALKNEKLSK